MHTGTLSIGLNADVHYVSSYVTADVQDPRTDQKGFARVNGGIRVFTNDDKYELALIGRNLTNKLYREYTTGKAFGKASGDFASTIPRGREIRMQGTVRF